MLDYFATSSTSKSLAAYSTQSIERAFRLDDHLQSVPYVQDYDDLTIDYPSTVRYRGM
jgi:hypothetical protein